jgi:adenylyltransferase/sulfurtransferase
MEVMKDYDIIIDGVDNFQTRYLLNDACFFMKKPMIEAGVIRYSGLNTTIIPGEGHCYRCLFPNMPKAGNAPACAENGVLGSVPGVMGFIQAAETIKYAIGRGRLLKDKILFFDAEDLEFNIVDTNKKLNCPLCGELPSINSLQEYEFSCENKHIK